MRTDPAKAGRSPGCGRRRDARASGGQRGKWRSWLRRWRTWLPFVVKPLRRVILLFIVALIIEYLVVPELVGREQGPEPARPADAAWLAAGVILEVLSLFCYGLLTQALLPPGSHNPGLSRLFRIDLAAAAIAHVIPAGTLGSAGIGYRLFTAEGIKGHDAAVMMATKGLGSTVVLNVLLWLSLVVSIPLAGFHPIYVTVAVIGAVLMLAIGALVFGFIRGARPRLPRILHVVGDRIPGLSGDRLEQAMLDAATPCHALGPRPAHPGHVPDLGLAQLDPRRRVAVVLRGRVRPLRQPGRAFRCLGDRQRGRRAAGDPGRARRGRLDRAAAAGQLRRHPQRGDARACSAGGWSTSGCPSRSAPSPTRP